MWQYCLRSLVYEKAVHVCSAALWEDVVLGWCLHHRPSPFSFSLLPFFSLKRRAGSANPISHCLEQTQPSIPCSVHTRKTKSLSFLLTACYVCCLPWPWWQRIIVADSRYLHVSLLCQICQKIVIPEDVIPRFHHSYSIVIEETFEWLTADAEVAFLMDIVDFIFFFFAN